MKTTVIAAPDEWTPERNRPRYCPEVTVRPLNLVLEHWRTYVITSPGKCVLRIIVRLPECEAETTLEGTTTRRRISQNVAAMLHARCEDAGLPGRDYAFNEDCHSGMWGDTVRLSGDRAGEKLTVSYGGWAVLASHSERAGELAALLSVVCEAGDAAQEGSAFIEMLSPLRERPARLEVVPSQGSAQVIALGRDALMIGRSPTATSRYWIPSSDTGMRASASRRTAGPSRIAAARWASIATATANASRTRCWTWARRSRSARRSFACCRRATHRAHVARPADARRRAGRPSVGDRTRARLRRPAPGSRAGTAPCARQPRRFRFRDRGPRQPRRHPSR